jgi:hypothetical protein
VKAKEPNVQPRLLDIKGAAAYLSVPVKCVRQLGWDGKLKPVRLGKRFVYDRVDLDKFVDGLKAA